MNSASVRLAARARPGPPPGSGFRVKASEVQLEVASASDSARAGSRDSDSEDLNLNVAASSMDSGGPESSSESLRQAALRRAGHCQPDHVRRLPGSHAGEPSKQRPAPPGPVRFESLNLKFGI